MVDITPPPPLILQPAVTPKTGVPTGSRSGFDQALWSHVSRGYPPMPCNVDGSNNLLVTPMLAAKNRLPSYGTFMSFQFMAVSTSTGPVLIDVVGGGASNGTLGELPAYDTAGVALGSGDIVIGRLYIAYYCPENASFPERFVVWGVDTTPTVPGQAAYAPIPCTAVSSGGTPNNMSLTPLPGLTVPSYFNLMSLVFKSDVNYAAATATTLNVSGLGAKTWFTFNYADASANSPRLVLGMAYIVTFEGTIFVSGV